MNQSSLTVSVKNALNTLGANLGKEKRKYMLCGIYCAQIWQALFLSFVLRILYIFGYLHCLGSGISTTLYSTAYGIQYHA